MFYEPHRTFCESCVKDRLCAGFSMIGPLQEMWICEDCLEKLATQIHRKKKGLVPEAEDSCQKGLAKKRRSSIPSIA
ncbi:hypothetical protein HOF92_11395 [bacterium]|jgi:hypothetical protein|nr:hypothetical protein [bacterium]